MIRKAIRRKARVPFASVVTCSAIDKYNSPVGGTISEEVSKDHQLNNLHPLNEFNKYSHLVAVVPPYYFATEPA